MANEVSIYEPRHLIEVVRTTPPIRTFLRDRFFSNVKTFPTRRVDIDIVKGNRKMAAFIHPLAGGDHFLLQLEHQLPAVAVEEGHHPL